VFGLLSGCGNSEREKIKSANLGPEEFTSVEGKFKVAFYGAPEAQSGKTDGIVTNSLATFEASGLMGVKFVDFPVLPAADDKELKRRYDGSQDFELASYGGSSKITSAKDIIIDNILGREFEGELEGKKSNVIRARLFLVGSRQYTVTVLGRSRDFIHSKRADKFFESFKIMK